MLQSEQLLSLNVYEDAQIFSQSTYISFRICLYLALILPHVDFLYFSVMNFGSFQNRSYIWVLKPRPMLSHTVTSYNSIQKFS